MRPDGLIVFDLDGTLVESSADLASAINATLDRIAPGTPPVSLQRVRSFVGNGAGALVARTLAEAGLPHDPADVLPLFLEVYRGRLLDTTVLYPGVREALDALRGFALAVLSNKPGDMSRTILQGLGVASRFARICGPEDVPRRKPDPAGLRWLMEDAGVGTAATVMVGDSAVDVQTGRAAGVRTVGVSYGLDPEGLRAEPPDVMIDDLRALPGHLGRPPAPTSVLP